MQIWKNLLPYFVHQWNRQEIHYRFTAVENGLPDEIILTKAAAIQPQLIILGRHHHNRMDRLFLAA